MRFTVAVVVGIITLGALAAGAVPAAAQELPLEYRTLACANDRLEALVGSEPNPPVPIFDMGYAVAFLGCAPYVGPAVVPILDAMGNDIETIHRYEERLGDVNWHLRALTCNAWLAIYNNEYEWVLSEYGSVAVGGLPTPADRAADCQRWVGNRSTSGATLRGRGR